MKRILSVLGMLLLVLVAYLLAWPVDVDPVAWQAPEAPPLTGRFESNRRLSSTQRLELPDGAGPEDVDVDHRGRVYGGLLDGRIVRFDPLDRSWATFADTGGRPLGLDFDRSGNLIVADAYKGLLSIDPDGEITVLATAADGVPFRFTNDVDVAPDGVIYFTDASSRYTVDDHKRDALDHRPYGRLLAHDRKTGTTRTLLSDLYFANGVAVSPFGDFLLVNETWEYRVRRYWLSGPRAGTDEILIDNLPGFPDGISTGNGVFWIAFASPRNTLVDTTADMPWVRKVIGRLPAWMQPDAVEYGFVLGIDAEGDVVRNLQDPDGHFAPITSVEEEAGVLFLGSLSDTAIGRWELPVR